MITATGPRLLRSLLHAVVGGAAVSLSVELVQLLSSTRNPSVLDLTTNTGGALLGGVTVMAVTVAVGRRVASRSYLGLPALVFAAAYGAATLGEALVPLLRQRPLSGVYGGPFTRFPAAAAAFDWGSVGMIPWMNALLFFPAGLLVVAALAEEGIPYRRAAAWTAWGGLAAVAAMEIGHGFLGLPIQIGPLLLHAAAIAFGALAATWILPPFTRRWRGAARSRAAFAAYGVVVLLWALRPYNPQADPQAILAELTSEWWMPLQFLSLRGDVYSVMDVVTGFLLYLPLGALLAVWPVRWTGPLRGFLPAVYLVAVAELLQLFVADRTLDVTDFLVNAAGAVVGWALLRRAGFGARGAMAAAGAPSQQV